MTAYEPLPILPTTDREGVDRLASRFPTGDAPRSEAAMTADIDQAARIVSAVDRWKDAQALEAEGRLRIRSAGRVKAEAVKALRATGLSLAAVGELLEVTAPTVQKYERWDDQ